MHSTENSKDCLFLNSASEVKELLNSHSEILTSNVLVVAITADADYACEKLGVSHKTIEDFYADETLMELGISNYAHVEEFCLELVPQPVNFFHRPKQKSLEKLMDV